MMRDDDDDAIRRGVIVWGPSMAFTANGQDGITDVHDETAQMLVEVDKRFICTFSGNRSDCAWRVLEVNGNVYRINIDFQTGAKVKVRHET